MPRFRVTKISSRLTPEAAIAAPTAASFSYIAANSIAIVSKEKVDDPIFRLFYADYREEERKIARELETRADSQLEYLDEGGSYCRRRRTRNGCSSGRIWRSKDTCFRRYFRTFPTADTH